MWRSGFRLIGSAYPTPLAGMSNQQPLAVAYRIAIIGLDH
jgi:hypothetical protein